MRLELLRFSMLHIPSHPTYLVISIVDIVDGRDERCPRTASSGHAHMAER